MSVSSPDNNVLGIQKGYREAVPRGRTGPTRSRTLGKEKYQIWTGPGLLALQKTRTMVATTAKHAKLVAPLNRRRTQLKEKGKTRSSKMITKRLPAGSGALKAIPTGKDFTMTTKDAAGSEQVNIKEYCKAIRSTTATFKDAHRATSTADEHDAFMRRVNRWAVRSGFGTYVVERDGATEAPTVKAAMDEKTGLPRVLEPEIIVGLLLEMATGDENMPSKGGHPEDLEMLESSDGKMLCGPRKNFKRKQGDYGYGAYADEPWSLQSMEKRIYALRDF